jgi:hypothetical protein
MGQDAAPARGIRNLASGTPWVAVRSNYVGLPSMAGRGPDKRRRKLPPVRARKHGPEARNRRSEASRGARSALWSARQAGGFAPLAQARLHGVDGYVAPLGASLPLICVSRADCARRAIRERVDGLNCRRIPRRKEQG